MLDSQPKESRAIRVLHLEDDPRDAELIRQKLKASGLQCEIVLVVDKKGFETALDGEAFDIVLSDYNLPDYDGLAALGFVREHRPELPVIVISGTVGEDEAVECLKAGAIDYVLKQQPQRLGSAVTRALHEAKEQHRLRLAETALRESEERFRQTFDLAASGIAHTRPDGRIILVNRRLCELLGYEESELMNMRFLDVTHKDDIELTLDYRRGLLAGETSLASLEKRYIRKDGSVLWAQLTVSAVHAKDGRLAYFVSIISDTTTQKRAEQAVRESEERFRSAMEHSAIGMALVAPEGRWLKVNRALCRITGYSEEELLTTDFQAITHPDDLAIDLEHVRRMLTREIESYHLEKRYIRKDGVVVWVLLGVSLLWASDTQPRHFIAQIQDITQRKQAEERLRDSEQRLDLALQASGLATWEWNLATGDVRFSQQWWPILGYQENDVALRIGAWENLTHPDDLVRVKAMLAAVVRGSSPVLDVEYRMRARSGEWRWIRSVGGVVERDGTGRVVRITGTHGDVTERRAQEHKIARLARIQAVLSGINSAIVRIRDRQELLNEACRIAVEHGGFSVGWVALLDHATGRLVPVAQAGLSIDLGVGNLPSDGAGGMVPAGVAEIALRDKRPAVDNSLEAAPGIPNSEAGSDTLSVRRAAIELGAKSVIVMPLFEEAQTFGVLTLYAPERDFFDDEELKLMKQLSADVSFALTFIAKEEKVNYLAYHDALTGLPNRALLFDRLGQYVHAAQRQQRVAAIILADLERFHVLNDSLGRSAGDAFLREIGNRLKEHVRAEDTVARVGGDSFAIALTNVGSAAEVAHLLQDRVSAFLRRPIALEGQELYPSARFGAAVYPSDGDSPETLYTNAEAALKDAKTTGEQFLFYAPEMNARIAESLALESKLRLALERGQFVLHYQPKVALRDRRLTGFEALIRWNDAELGLVPPVKFIPLMEQTGLILDAGRWALSQVVRDCRSWSTNGVKPPRVAVNASPLQLRQKDFVDSVIEAAEKTREAGGMLDLEITESLIMENVEAVTHKLQTIRELGVEISVDDFGTGYSSLAYVARLPIHALKIDRSFVVGMTDSRESLAIVNSVISMAHALSLQVVAEGVETEEQAAQLEKLGCDQMQGYLISRPVPPQEVPALLRRRAASNVRPGSGKARRAVKPGRRGKSAPKN